MATPWSSVAQVKQVIADCLNQDITKLATKWARILDAGDGTGALYDAAGDCVRILLSKGYTIGQINAWDERFTYNSDIAAHLALVKGGAAQSYDQTTIDKLDRRKMLENSAGIMINGELVTPESDPGGSIGVGRIDLTASRITMDTVL